MARSIFYKIYLFLEIFTIFFGPYLIQFFAQSYCYFNICFFI